MEVQVSRTNPVDAEVDAVLVPVVEHKRTPRALRELDDALAGAISAHLQAGTFAGKGKELVQLPAGDAVAATRVILIGLGDARKGDGEALRRAAASGVRALRSAKLTSAALVMPEGGRVPTDQAGRALCEGALLGHYRFDRYKTDDKAPPEVDTLQLLVRDARHAGAVRRGVSDGTIIAESTCLARDLSNEPGGVATPEYLAKQARTIAGQVGLKVTVFNERELARRKMHAILAVGRGAENPPRLITLEHGKPAAGARRRPTIALVGKGITFDSGGISIKPAPSMDEMKHDMSGGAAVLAAMRAIALLKLPLHVVGIVACAQNMPDGKAYLPGDIVTASNGKTIEVLNTDAEGRVVLSDALVWAGEFEPDAIVDLATLTGACIIALGHACAAVLGNDDKLIDRLRKAGERTRERVWPLPLWDEYQKAIKGKVGDIANTGGREAGTITAAAFLSHFVGETPWAHVDIAGTAWGGETDELTPKGASGYGVQLLVDLLQNWRK
jgi:leucyl aminopeptidase